jgi:hypothetical protein
MDISPTENSVLKKFDYKVISNDFINFFYSSWNLQPNNLASVLNDYSTLCFKDIKYKGPNALKCFVDMKNGDLFSINQSWWNALESGTRRIDILATGNVTKGLIKYNFVQQFTLAHNDSWRIHNSILNIF